jgi:hypothetical protein
MAVVGPCGFLWVQCNTQVHSSDWFGTQDIKTTSLRNSMRTLPIVLIMSSDDPLFMVWTRVHVNAVHVTVITARHYWRTNSIRGFWQFRNRHCR